MSTSGSLEQRDFSESSRNDGDLPTSTRRQRATPSQMPLEPLATHETSFSDRAAKKDFSLCLLGSGRFLEWYILPRHFTEYFFSLDLSAIYRRHLVWAKTDGASLRTLVTERFTSTTVFLSLLLSAEIGILFSPSDIMEEVRAALDTAQIIDTDLKFWAGLILTISILVSIAGLLANFSAFTVLRAVSDENAAIILRSSLGLYAANLPSILATFSIYFFFITIMLFTWILLPKLWAIILIFIGFGLIVHIASTFSAVARVIMATSAMSHGPILCKEEEELLDPRELNDLLVYETRLAYQVNIPVKHQYRMEDYHGEVRRHELERRGCRPRGWTGRRKDPDKEDGLGAANRV